MQRRIEMPIWYLIVGCVLSIFIVSVMGFFYTHSVDEKRASSERAARQQNNRSWCALLDPLDMAYSANVPTTELGQQVAVAIHNLAVDFGCN